MRISEKRLNRIIKESMEDFFKRQSVDSFTPYSEKEAAINKAAIGNVGNPSYDNAPKANTAPREYGGYPTVGEWQEKYPNMPYREYCWKIYGVKLR